MGNGLLLHGISPPRWVHSSLISIVALYCIINWCLFNNVFAGPRVHMVWNTWRKQHKVFQFLWFPFFSCRFRCDYKWPLALLPAADWAPVPSEFHWIGLHVRCLWHCRHAVCRPCHLPRRAKRCPQTSFCWLWRTHNGHRIYTIQLPCLLRRPIHEGGSSRPMWARRSNPWRGNYNWLFE